MVLVLGGVAVDVIIKITIVDKEKKNELNRLHSIFDLAMSNTKLKGKLHS